MKQFNKNQIHLMDPSNEKSQEMSKKLLKLKYLLQNSKHKTNPNLEKSLNFKDYNGTSSIKSSSYSQQQESGLKMSKDLSLYLSLIEKPLNLLFSIDQFLFEFSKKTYQQKKTGEFYHQLKERKKLSLFYGHLTRKEIVNIFTKVKKNKGYFAKNLFSFLERRLDVVLYRSGLTKTIAEARQLIKHKKILVNHQIVNVPSYLLNPGDFISFTPKTVDILSNQLEILIKKTNNKKNWNSLSRTEFYSKLTKTLNFSLLPFPKFVSSPKFETNLGKGKGLHTNFGQQRVDFHKSKKVSIKFSMNFQSKLLCDLMIQLICTKIRLRSYWNLKKKEFYSNNFNHNNRFSKNLYLTLFKWKSVSESDKKRVKNENYLKKSSIEKNNTENLVYANQGCLQKKPIFWNMVHLKKNKKLFFKNSRKSLPKFHEFGAPKNVQFQSKKNLNILKKKNVRFYRTSFFVFLKSLENSNKFTGLITLSMKKILFQKSKHNSFQNFSNFGQLAKILKFRRIRPLHLEVSYNLLNLVYLFSPQRINFPFYIDIDLINRSLR